MSGRRPILVTGMGRSGTTWVGLMLAASREAGYVHEPFSLDPDDLRLWGFPGGQRYPYVTAENDHEYRPGFEALLHFRFPLLRQLRARRGQGDALRVVLTWLNLRRRRRRRPLIKEPHAVFSIDWFLEQLGCDVVVTVRHPLAVVGSWKRLGWDVDPADLTREPCLAGRLGPFVDELKGSRDLVDRVSILWRAVYSLVAEIEHPRLHVVRHEDLSQDPVGGYAKLFAALGLTFTQRAAETVAASSRATNRPETLVDRPYETNLDSRANLERWRERLTDDEITRIRTLTRSPARLYYPE